MAEPMYEQNYPDLPGMFGEVISRYTREEAIADEVLYDLTEWARETGFKVPVAVTAAVYHDLANVPSTHSFESLRGRAHDLLWMSYMASKRNPTVQQVEVSMYLNTEPGNDFAQPYTVKSHIGPGDRGEPVITIMKLDED